MGQKRERKEREREREIFAAPCYPPALYLPVAFETYLSHAWGRYRLIFFLVNDPLRPPPNETKTDLLLKFKKVVSFVSNGNLPPLETHFALL